MPRYFSRTAKAVTVREGAPSYAEVFEVDETARVSAYSSAGHLAYSTAQATIVLDRTGKEIAKVVAAADLTFSPQGTFLVTWNRLKKDPESGHWLKNLAVWRVAEPSAPVAEFVQKSAGNWSVQWSADEKTGIRQTSPTALAATSPDFASETSKLTIAEGIETFAVSGGRNPAVAVFIPPKKGKPAGVRIYKLPAFNQPVATRTLVRCESVQLLWNNIGTSLLVQAMNDVDKTGKSYYGDSTLYLMNSASGTSQLIVLQKEGPIHDIAWSPTQNEFGIVHGYMPSRTTFFDGRGREIHSLPLSARNTLKYSPHGRFIVVAGFGNLQGEVEIYDRDAKYELITQLQAPNTSYYDWSPCGKYLLTATTSPRLRVDNGVRLWHYTGKYVYAHDDEELLGVQWLPETLPLELSEKPVVHSSVEGRKVPVTDKPKSAYRPPHARGTAQVERTTLYERSQSSASLPPEPKSKTGGNGNSAVPAPGSEEKQRRALQKKLRAITELKQRQAAGEKLENTQIQKIASENEVLEKLKEFGL